MTFPTSRQVDSADRVASTIDGALSQMLDQAQSFRAAVNAESQADTARVRQVYMSLTSTRRFVEQKKTTAGLAESYKRSFAHLGEQFDPAAEWATSKAALDTLIIWLQANLPKDASGRPVFERFATSTGELESFVIPIAGAGKAALLANLDAMLATFG